MKHSLLLIPLTISLSCLGLAQTPNSSGNTADTQPSSQSSLMILSKQGGGLIFRNLLSLTLLSGRVCDQTQSRIPDGSRMVSDSFAFNLNGSGFGTFYGSVRIVSPGGEILHTGVLRGTVGINACEAVPGTVCPNVCNRVGHLEGIYEPVPTLASNPNGQIMLANFKADLNPFTASPLPFYGVRLDGWFTAPPTLAQRIEVAPDKSSYSRDETISVKITNGSEKTIQGQDLKSRCSILELQRQENNRWVSAGQCFLKRASFPVNIGPGETLQVDLRPGSASAPVPPGVYRAALVFKVLEDEKVIADSFVAFSPLFRITDMPRREGVRVAVDRKRYIVGQVIKVTVDNNTDQAIQTYDHQTSCSIVTVQRLKDGNWIIVGECPLLSPTLPVKIASRQMVEVKFSTGVPGLNLEPGDYRIEFSYFELDSNEQITKPGVKLYSSQFTVAPRE